MIAKKLVKNLGLIALSAVLAWNGALTLQAEEKTWTGAVDGSWTNGGNWSPGPLLTDLDSVLYDASSIANLSQTLDQDWSITGLRVASAPNAITINPGSGSFTLTNTGGIDMSLATADLTILAPYYPINNGTLTVAANRTLTFSNILARIDNTFGALAGAGTVRITGSAERLTDLINSVTLIVDGGSVVGNPPVRLAADPGSTVTLLLTNNGSANITSGNSTRIHLGGTAFTESTNHFIIDGGSVDISASGSSGANGIYVGSASGTTGILDINNGTVDMSARVSGMAFSVLRIGNDIGSVGIVNLNANGRLLAPRIDRISGYAIFNFNGGYLETTTPRDDYFLDVDEVHLLAGGGVIDTGNRIVSVVTSLLGAGGLTKLGSGLLNLTGTNHTYAGATVVSNGAMTVTLPLASSALFLNTNATLTVNVSETPNASWTSASITLVQSNTLTFNYGPGSQPTSTLLNTTTLNATGTNVINIGGAGWATGTIRLIDYNGSINGGGKFVLGVLPVGLNAKLTNDLTSSSINLVVASGVNLLEWYGYNAFGNTSGGLWDIATSLNWNGGADVYNEYGTGTNQLGDSVRFTPQGYNLVEIATNVRPSSVTVSNLNTLPYTFAGPGKISGPTSLTKEGNNATSTLTISTKNDYTGGTYIRTGALTLGTDDALPPGGVVYLGSPGTGATLNFNGFNQTIAGLVSTGSGSGTRRVLSGSLTPSVLTINVPANLTTVYAHTMGNPSVASTDPANNYSLVKNGAGVQTLANSAYGGPTTINAGTLLFNGATTVGSPITAKSGGAVGGNGTGANSVLVPVTVESGGRLEPGNLGIGTFTVSNTVTLQGQAIFQINPTNSPNSDKLVANAISLSGSLVVTNLGDAPQVGNTFTLLVGSATGSFSSVILPPLTSGLAWNTNSLYSGGVISVVAIPQPTFLQPTVSGNNLILAGTGGTANGTYYVLSSTNVALPLNSWTTLATNNFDASGGFSYTNVIDPAVSQRFFRLQTP